MSRKRMEVQKLLPVLMRKAIPHSAIIGRAVGPIVVTQTKPCPVSTNNRAIFIWLDSAAAQAGNHATVIAQRQSIGLRLKPRLTRSMARKTDAIYACGRLGRRIEEKRQ
jgi:hypothetical protein